MGGCCEIMYSNLSNALAVEHTISISRADLHSKLTKKIAENYKLKISPTKFILIWSAADYLLDLYARFSRK
jgi:hypothetical protein